LYDPNQLDKGRIQMGNIDIVTKHYLEDSRIFADAFNYFIYDGKPVIQPEQLRPLDAVATATPDGETPVQKTRDLLKCLVAMEDDNFCANQWATSRT